MRRLPFARFLMRIVVVESVAIAIIALPAVAHAASSCASGSGHTVCVSVPDGALGGAVPITVTNSPNSGSVTASWIPSGHSAIKLIVQFAPSPLTHDYSFTWPTEKYLDASGTLRVQYSSAQVNLSVTLSNGNTNDFQHSPSDWASFLPPSSWGLDREPVIAAVGDGAGGEQVPADNASGIAAGNPDLFLYLGDIYDTGTFTENLNHYGANSMDGGPGTFWGQMGTVTQPTLGNHEAANKVAWQDYFHGRPLYTSFVLGNVLFLDLASSGESMAAGSAQYNYVRSVLTSTTSPPPPCIVAFWHIPALAKGTIKSGQLALWSLLADNGGDLVLNGHEHSMVQYEPLNDQLQLPSGGQATMVQLVNGAGGHSLGGTASGDSRIEWSKGGTPGAIWLTPNGSANGGTPTALTWAYEGTNGTALHTGTRDCSGSSAPPGLTVTGFSPTSGPVGTSVAITGSGFAGTTGVAFTGASADSFTIDSDVQITATVPSGATTGPITVTTASDAATSSTSFTVTSGSVLAITGFSPTSGPVGTSVTIAGSGFTGVTVVKFNGTKASFTVDSDVQITATVPSGATTGPIKVKTALGAATSSGSFSVT